MSSEMIPETHSPNPQQPIRSDHEVLHPNFTRHWLDSRQIVVFTLHSLTRQSIDAGFNGVAETMGTWPKGQIYLAVYDFRATTFALSPYLRARLRELRKLSPELRGYVAVVIGRGVLAHLMALFIREIHKDYRPLRLFFTEADALAWLRTR